jgi:hypothetical protein
VCIVELASVVAGERFSDHPRCVCAVIAAFLRGWNDRAGYAERQRLRPYAERIVGSRASRPITHRRRDLCLAWAGAELTGGRLSRALWRLAMRVRVFVLCGLRPALDLNRGAGELAARVVFASYGAEAGLALIDALLEIASEPSPAHATRNGPRGNGNGARSGTNGDARVNGSSAVRERELRPLVEGAVNGSADRVLTSPDGGDPEEDHRQEPVGTV